MRITTIIIVLIIIHPTKPTVFLRRRRRRLTENSIRNNLKLVKLFYNEFFFLFCSNCVFYGDQSIKQRKKSRPRYVLEKKVFSHSNFFFSLNRFVDDFMSNTSSRLEIRLKEREDEYTSYKQFYVLVGTFNVNNRQAPSNILLQQWLQQVTNREETKEEYIPDIIAVGFQEIDTSGGAYIYDDKKKEDDWEQTVKKTIAACYEQKENVQFELLNRVRLMGKYPF